MEGSVDAGDSAEILADRRQGTISHLSVHRTLYEMRGSVLIRRRAWGSARLAIPKNGKSLLLKWNLFSHWALTLCLEGVKL